MSRTLVASLLVTIIAVAMCTSISSAQQLKTPSTPIHLNLTGFEFDAFADDATNELYYQFGFGT
jgi:hypothetical protein